jgi:hypothetical protein
MDLLLGSRRRFSARCAGQGRKAQLSRSSRAVQPQAQRYSTTVGRLLCV